MRSTRASLAAVSKTEVEVLIAGTAGASGMATSYSGRVSRRTERSPLEDQEGEDVGVM